MARGSTFQAPIRVKNSSGTLVTVIDDDGNIDAPVTTTNLTTTGTTTLGDAGDAAQVNGPLTVGVDDTGYDVKIFGATASKFMVWDQSADDLILADAVDLQLGGDESTADGFKLGFDGTDTLALNAITANDKFSVGATVDTDTVLNGANGSVTLDASADTLAIAGLPTTLTTTLTVGVNDTGHDVQFFGATAGSHLLWDESADTLKLVGAAKLDVAGTTALQGVTTVTAASGIVSTVATLTAPFIPAAAQETAAPAAALSLATYCSLLDSNAGATTQTLAASTVVGQMKRIQMIVDGGDDVVTIATGVGGNTLTFQDVGDVAELMWNGSGWVPVALYNCADGATAPTWTTV